MRNLSTNGGPAFPQEGGLEQLESPEPVQGMSLRDYFAAKAMEAFASSAQGLGGVPIQEVTRQFNEVARYAYLMADAMLKARQA